MKNLLIICIVYFSTYAYSQTIALTRQADYLAVNEVSAKNKKNIFAAPRVPLIREVRWTALERLLNSNTDTTYIVNFWATWCGPCVEELPYFERLTRNFAGQKVRVVLVSMDFVKDKERRVVPFVERLKLENAVWLLNEPDANSWIDRVDPSWSGALPATLILNARQKKRTFYEKALTYEALSHALGYFTDY